MVNIKEYIKESNAIERVYDESAVTQSMEAWDFLKEIDELTHDTIKEAHKLFLKERQPNIAGTYRDVFVRVGNDVPPAPEEIEERMDGLLSENPSNPVEALQWHVKFEKIHPFQDGNGRIGRLIYAWHCFKMGEEPIVWREEDKQGYYSLFA